MATPCTATGGSNPSSVRRYVTTGRPSNHSTMATLPTCDPRPYLGVEIRCSWPSAAFYPGAMRSRDGEVYEAWPTPSRCVRAGTLTEIRKLIREALVPA
jgi:hypothetical protein